MEGLYKTCHLGEKAKAKNVFVSYPGLTVDSATKIYFTKKVEGQSELYKRLERYNVSYVKDTPSHFFHEEVANLKSS